MAVARGLAPAIRKEAWFLDFNSASPGAKKKAAALIDGAGGRFVEGAVMTSVPPHRIRVPLLLGGPARCSTQAAARCAGLRGQGRVGELGVASATKMCRSVMIKGLEAMVVESFTAARAYGVEDAVLASLAETFPGIDWERQGAYFFQRVIQHGRRRAEEMRRGGGDRPRNRARAVVRAGHGHAPGVRGRSRRRGTVRPTRRRRRSPAAPDWRIEADRILSLIRDSNIEPE